MLPYKRNGKPSRCQRTVEEHTQQFPISKLNICQEQVQSAAASQLLTPHKSYDLAEDYINSSALAGWTKIYQNVAVYANTLIVKQCAKVRCILSELKVFQRGSVQTTRSQHFEQ